MMSHMRSLGEKRVESIFFIVAILKDIFCFRSGQPHGFAVGQFGLQPVFPVRVGDCERRALVQGAVLL